MYTISPSVPGMYFVHGVINNDGCLGDGTDPGSLNYTLTGLLTYPVLRSNAAANNFSLAIVDIDTPPNW